MGDETLRRCPTCGQPAVRIDRVHEPVTSGFGTPPEPRIVDRWTCANGHQWYPFDEKNYVARAARLGWILDLIGVSTIRLTNDRDPRLVHDIRLDVLEDWFDAQEHQQTT